MLVKGKQQKIPKEVLTAFIQLLTKYTTGATYYTTNTHSRTIQVKKRYSAIDDRSEYDGQGIHWERMDGYCAHSTAPHTNHEQATTHGLDGLL